MKNQNRLLLKDLVYLMMDLEDWLHTITPSDLEETNFGIGRSATQDSRQIVINTINSEVYIQWMKFFENIEWHIVYVLLHQVNKLISLLQDTRYSEHTHILKCMYICSEIVVIQNRRIQKLLN